MCQSWSRSQKNVSIWLWERSFHTTRFLLIIQVQSLSSFTNHSEIHLTWCRLSKSKSMGSYTFYYVSDTWRLRWMNELYFYSVPRIGLIKIHSYSSAALQHIIAVKILLDRYPKFHCSGLPDAFSFWEALANRRYALLSTLPPKAVSCIVCISSMIPASASWDLLGSSSNNTTINSPA